MSTRALTFAPTGLFDMLVRSVVVSWANLPALIGLGLIVFVPVAGLSTVAYFVSPILGAVVGIIGMVLGLFYYYAAATLLVALSMSGARAGLLQLLRHLRGSVSVKILGTSFLVSLAISLGMILLVIPGIVLSVRFMFALPVVILEGIAYREALGRSSALISGYWWRTLGALVLVYVAFYVVLFLVGLMPVPSSWSIWVLLAAEVLCMPILYTFPILLYFDTRTRKDGFVDLGAIGEGA